MKNATDYFKFLVRRDEIIGFMCGTLAEGEQLEHASMSDHKPNGSTLSLFSPLWLNSNHLFHSHFISHQKRFAYIR